MKLKVFTFLFAFLISATSGYSQNTGQAGEIKINQDFRQGNPYDGDSPSYSPYPQESSEPLIPSPPLVKVEEVKPEPEVIPEPVAPVVVDPPVPPAPPVPKFPEPQKKAPSIEARPVQVPPVREIQQPTAQPSSGRFGYTGPVAPPVVVLPPPQRAQVRPPQPEVYAVPQSAFPTALPQPAPQAKAPVSELRIPTVSSLRHYSWVMGKENIEYKFGRNHPAFGGLDSSGAVQFLLHEIGMIDVPRTTGGLNSWLRVNNTLLEFRGRPSVQELTARLVPGNLIFWGDPDTRRLHHVMVYLGYDPDRGHLAFGTRGGTEMGINQSEVDIFRLSLDRERIISTGAVPGMVRK